MGNLKVLRAPEQQPLWGIHTKRRQMLSEI